MPIQTINGVTKMARSLSPSVLEYAWPNGGVHITVYTDINEAYIHYPSGAPRQIVPFDELQEADKLGAANIEELVDEYATRGFFFSVNEIVYISSYDQLPDPVGGVIDLGDDAKKYIFTRDIDVQGNTVDFGNNVISGLSQEVGGITNGALLIDQTCTVRDIKFDSVSAVINAPLGAFDWKSINFFNSSNIDIQAAQNIVWDTFGFINTYNVQITGEVDSFILAPNNIFRSVTTEVCDFFAVRSTAVINRRIRIEDSVFVTDFLTQNPINVEAGATIPVEGFKMEDVNFAGPGSISGINGGDDIANFQRCTGDGVVNSTSIANLYIQNNQALTPVAVAGDKYKVVGTTQVSAIIQRFTHDAANNTLEYTSSVSRIFRIQAPYTVFAGNNNIVGAYIAVTRAGNTENPNTDVIGESEMYTTTNGARPIAGASQCIVALNQGDKVYFAVENENGNDVRVEFLNMIIETANV